MFQFIFLTVGKTKMSLCPPLQHFDDIHTLQDINGGLLETNILLKVVQVCRYSGRYRVNRLLLASSDSPQRSVLRSVEAGPHTVPPGGSSLPTFYSAAQSFPHLGHLGTKQANIPVKFWQSTFANPTSEFEIPSSYTNHCLKSLPADDFAESPE